MIIMGKYTKLYEQYQNAISEANSRLRDLPKGTQAYKAFKKMRYELYSSNSRTQKFKSMSYPRNPNQADKMIKELNSINKFLGYKSSTDEGRIRAKEQAEAKFQEKGYSMSRDEFIDWLVRSKGFQELAQYDSQRAMEIVSKLEEHIGDEDWEDINDVEDIGDYLDNLVEDARKAGGKNPITRDKKLNRLLKKEKDREVREAVFDFLERLVSKWDTN